MLNVSLFYISRILKTAIIYILNAAIRAQGTGDKFHWRPNRCEKNASWSVNVIKKCYSENVLRIFSFWSKKILRKLCSRLNEDYVLLMKRWSAEPLFWSLIGWVTLALASLSNNLRRAAAEWTYLSTPSSSFPLLPSPSLDPLRLINPSFFIKLFFSTQLYYLASSCSIYRILSCVYFREDPLTLQLIIHLSLSLPCFI